MKVLCILAVVSYTLAYNTRLETIRHMNVRDLPSEVAQFVQKRGSTDNFCCKNTPVTIVTKTRLVKREKTSGEEYKVGDQECSLWGLKKCDKYDMRYKTVYYYEVETYPASADGSCPEESIVCCNGYIFVKAVNKCVLLSELSRLLDELEG